ncbi:MAG: hypothetical protein I8H75_06275 [Myxococcaceae bacterium]|nr:hypothetical protein [Myxococcaceae bacterium]
MRYSIPEGYWRFVGRYESGFIADERILNPEQQERFLPYSPKPTVLREGPFILLDDPELSTAEGFIAYTGKEAYWLNLSQGLKQSLKSQDLIVIGNTTLEVL